MSEQSSRREFLVATAGVALATGCGGATTSGPSTDPGADPMAYPGSTRPAVGPMDTNMPTCPTTTGLIQGPLAASLNVNAALQVAGRIYVVRDSKGTYAINLTCSHAGCQPNLEAATQTWLCPCHGSRWNIDGSLIIGPAGQPLTRYAVCEGTDGRLYYDQTKVL